MIDMLHRCGCNLRAVFPTQSWLSTSVYLFYCLFQAAHGQRRFSEVQVTKNCYCITSHDRVLQSGTQHTSLMWKNRWWWCVYENQSIGYQLTEDWRWWWLWWIPHMQNIKFVARQNYKFKLKVITRVFFQEVACFVCRQSRDNLCNCALQNVNR